MAKGKKKSFEDIKASVDKLVASHDELNLRFDTWNKMYLLEPTGLPTGDYVKDLYHPLPHTIVEMAGRIYCSSPVMVSVPSPTGDLAARKAADKVERFLRGVIDTAGGERFLKSLVSAIAIFDEETILIDPWGLVDDEAEIPFALTVPNPKLCYVEYTMRGGVLRHAYRASLKLSQIREHYGERETRFIEGGDDLDRTLVDYVDREVHCVYVEEAPEKEILFERHELGFVPRQAAIATGPTFQEEEVNKRQSMLYTLDRARLWEAACLSLTLANSNTFAFLNPQWVKRSSNPAGDRMAKIDLKETGKVHIIGKDESIDVLAKQLIPQEQFQMLQQIEIMAEAATMPKIMAGTAPFAGITASATHTLSTNARLITQPVAKAAGLALSEACQIILRMIAKQGDSVQVYGLNGVDEIAPSDLKQIGERVRVVVELRADVSLEKQMNAQLAAQLRSLGAGYNTVFELLEEGGIIPSAEQAMDDMLVSKFVDLNLKPMAEQAAQEAGVALQAANELAVPKPLGIETAGMAPSAPALAEALGGLPPQATGPEAGSMAGAPAGFPPEMLGPGVG
jgi:hypothetical protein